MEKAYCDTATYRGTVGPWDTSSGAGQGQFINLQHVQRHTKMTHLSNALLTNVFAYTVVPILYPSFKNLSPFII